ncbi:hypothetical protein, partial [Dactylosporangium sp. NPDC048998]|uniref:hypothetical protein n=1 Tax=Dactylosporangium sp. NPDC048998 TaxID=3363976 RepID=UPI0037230091
GNRQRVGHATQDGPEHPPRSRPASKNLLNGYPELPRWKQLSDGSRHLQMPLRQNLVVHPPTGAILWQFREVALCGRSTRVADLEVPEWVTRAP